MKSMKYIGIFAFTALMGLCSCSTDKLSNDSTVSQSKGHKVSLTIGSGAKTRAAEPTALGGFAREKAIDGDKLYAVVFDQQGKFFEAIKITDYNSGDNTCSFTLSEAGVFYGYIVANTSIDLTSASLTKGSSDEDALYNLIEDTDPGTALAASTNFMMTSKRTLFDVDGDADTNLGSVSLIRSAARIDIDATEIDGLEVTKVVVENRYKKSLLVRGNNPDDTSLGAATPTDTKTYTRGTSAGEVDALNDGTGLVNDRQWQGVIYGYENINTNTVVKITHTLNGVASTTTLDFSTINGGQAIKRNNIYTVKLTNEVLSPTLQNIVASITVEDWDDSVNLAYTDLTDHEKPDYIVTSGHMATEFTSSNLNPGRIHAEEADSPTEITLQVTSQGKVASNVSFVDKSNAAYDFFGEGGAIEQVGESTLTDGKIVQNYKITIPQSVFSSMTGLDYLTFKVHNVFDDTETASRNFIVKTRYGGIAVGDIIYQDGTWSHGSSETAIALSQSKIPVAIVFSTTTSTYDQNLGYTHGYALALKNYNNSQRFTYWSDASLKSTQVTDVFVNNLNDQRNDLDGLKHCQTANNYCTNNSIDKSKLTAIYAAMTSYESQVSAPIGTSGWYLPSIGQLYTLLKATRPSLFTGSEVLTNYGNTNWGMTNEAATTANTIDAWFSDSGLTSSQFDAINYKNNTNTTDSRLFWSSTEFDATHASLLGFYSRSQQDVLINGGASNTTKNTTDAPSGIMIRPVFAF